MEIGFVMMVICGLLGLEGKVEVLWVIVKDVLK